MKKLSILIISIICLDNLYCSGIEQFSLDLKKDVVLGIGSVSTFSAGNILRFNSDPDPNPFNWPDEDFTFEYNSDLDTLCDYLYFSPLLTLPLLLDEYNFESISNLVVMGAETGFFIYGSKYILKSVIQRPRPYNDYTTTPSSLLEDDDRNYSFPSGHTATAFGCATFCTYIYSQGDGTSSQKYLMGISTYSIAALTGALRIYSGNHYLTDVLAGAALGTSVGFLVPYSHKKSSTTNRVTPVIGYNSVGFSLLL